MTPDQFVGLLLVLSGVVTLVVFYVPRPRCWCGAKLRHVGAIKGDLCATHWAETFK